MIGRLASGIRSAARKSSYIVREEGPVTFLDRACRIGIVKVRRALQDKAGNCARWADLRGRYEGRRAFMLGNGPSLNETPLHLLRDEHVMCFNRFYLMYERLAWRPDMYAISDDRVALDIADEVVEQVLPTVDLAFFPDIHPYNVDFRKLIPDRDNVYWLYLDRLGFADDLPWAGMNKTVANVGLQVLAYLGFNPIYLLGVDMSYSRPDSIVEKSSRDWTSTADDDPNHFDPRYFGKGSQYHAPRMDETLEKYIEGERFFSERGVEIVNAGVGGELEVFPRRPIRALFAEVTAAEERRLLVEAAARSDSSLAADRLADLPRATVPFDADLEGAWLDTEECSRLLPGLLRTHLVFGPHSSGEYLVTKRASGPAWE